VLCALDLNQRLKSLMGLANKNSDVTPIYVLKFSGKLVLINNLLSNKPISNSVENSLLQLFDTIDIEGKYDEGIKNRILASHINSINAILKRTS
jgi:hypothetical protein